MPSSLMISLLKWLSPHLLADQTGLEQITFSVVSPVKATPPWLYHKLVLYAFNGKGAS